MVTTDSTVREITVAESATPDLEKVVRRLVRTAKRLGLTPEPRLEIDWSTRREVTQRRTSVSVGEDGAGSESHSTYLVPVVTAHLQLPDTGAVQATGGWRVLGSLTKTDEGLEVNAFAAANIPFIAPYRDHNRMECDHCRANRNRSKTIVIRDAAGTTKQVGRECVHAYVTDLALVLGALEFQELIVALLGGGDGEPVEYGFSGARTLRAFDTVDALTEVCACIRADGRYIPSKSWIKDDHHQDGGYYDRNPNATWRTVVRQMTERKRLTAQERLELAEKIERVEAEMFAASVTAGGANVDEVVRTAAMAVISAKIAERRALGSMAEVLYPLATEDAVKANELIAWLETVTAPDNEFLAALKDVAVAGFVSERKVALWAALPVAKERHEREAARVNNPPATLAPEGRHVVEGTVLSVKEKEGFNGASVWKMTVELTDRNRVYVSVPSGLDAETLARGAHVKFKATFTRSHDDAHFAFGKVPKLVA